MSNEPKPCPLIELTRGKFAKVSPEDYLSLSQHKWYASVAHNRHYAARVWRDENGKSRTIYMHREIVGVFEDEVDHINGDSLDNRRENLRVTTHRNNLRNQLPQDGRTSRFKGVYWQENEQSWTVQIKDHGRFRAVHGIANEEIAARVYDLLAIDRFGEYARPNFTDSWNRRAPAHKARIRNLEPLREEPDELSDTERQEAGYPATREELVDE